MDPAAAFRSVGIFPSNLQPLQLQQVRRPGMSNCRVIPDVTVSTTCRQSSCPVCTEATGVVANQWSQHNSMVDMCDVPWRCCRSRRRCLLPTLTASTGTWGSGAGRGRMGCWCCRRFGSAWTRPLHPSTAGELPQLSGCVRLSSTCVTQCAAVTAQLLPGQGPAGWGGCWAMSMQAIRPDVICLCVQWRLSLWGRVATYVNDTVAATGPGCTCQHRSKSHSHATACCCSRPLRSAYAEWVKPGIHLDTCGSDPAASVWLYEFNDKAASESGWGVVQYTHVRC